MLELGELGSHGDLSRHYPEGDLDFLEKVQDGLYERPLNDDALKFLAEANNRVIPLADKIRGAVPKILLAASFGVLSLGAVLGNREIFAGGVFLGSLWHQSIEPQGF